MGMSVEKKFYPVMGRDGDGKTRICFDRYTVSIPLYDYHFVADSVSGAVRAVAHKATRNVVEGVDFAPSQNAAIRCSASTSYRNSRWPTTI